MSKKKEKKIPWNRFIPFHELVVRLFLNFLTHSVFQNENFPKKYILTMAWPTLEICVLFQVLLSTKIVLFAMAVIWYP